MNKERANFCDEFQFADRIFKSVLLLVFSGKEINDIDTFRQNDQLLDRATLGKLVGILKPRVVLNAGFENILFQYLNNRNSLVHNRDEIEGWEDEIRAIEFTSGVKKKAAYFRYKF